MKNTEKRFSKVFKKLSEHLSREKKGEEKSTIAHSVSSREEFEEINELRRLSEEFSSAPTRLFTQT